MKYLFSTLVRKKHVKITFYNEFTLNYYFIMKPGDCALVQWNIETLTTHLLVFSSEEKERQLPQQLTSLEGNGHCLLPVSSVVEMVTHPQLAGPLLVADLRLLVPALHPHPPQQLAGRCMGVQRIPRLRIPCVSCSFIYIIPATRYSIFLFHHLDNCYTTFC